MKRSKLVRVTARIIESVISIIKEELLAQNKEKKQDANSNGENKKDNQSSRGDNA